MRTALRTVCLVAFAVAFPVPGACFVPHEYPAVYTHQVGALFYFIALLIVAHRMASAGLSARPGWRHLFRSVILFLVWDAVVFSSRVVEMTWGAPLSVIGETDGPGYFFRLIELSGAGFLYYAGRFDFILLDCAMFCYYLGLREFSRVEESKSPAQITALLPLLPVIVTEIGGNIVFIILAALSFRASLSLYRTDRENPFWSYLVWLSASYVLFALSRSFGHVFKHLLLASGNPHIWAYLDSVSGSINTSVRFLVAALTLFFIWIYRIYIKVDRDREEITEVNRDLAELNRELETLVAERTMALMGLSVADRVRNPAMLIGCMCKRLMNRQNDEKATRDLNEILSECKRLESIVGDFENLLKNRKSMYTFEDVNALLENLISFLVREASESAGKVIRFEKRFSVSAIRMNMQKNLLKAALYHILKNAVEATPEDGTITVTTELKGEKVHIRIMDTGAGIDPDSLTKIFEPFFSTKGKRFGMGLPLVKQIVDEHLGEIRVESEIGKGTTFTLMFPLRWSELPVMGK